MLSSANYEIVDARSGDEALLKFRDFLPDLVLLDLNMAGMGGLRYLPRHSRKLRCLNHPSSRSEAKRARQSRKLWMPAQTITSPMKPFKRARTFGSYPRRSKENALLQPAHNRTASVHRQGSGNRF